MDDKDISCNVKSAQFKTDPFMDDKDKQEVEGYHAGSLFRSSMDDKATTGYKGRWRSPFRVQIPLWTIRT